MSKRRRSQDFFEESFLEEHWSRRIGFLAVITSDTETRKNIFFLAFCLIIFAVGILLIRNMPTLSDENVYAPHIARIISENNLFPNVVSTPLPGYHWSIALLLKITGSHSVNAMRLLTSLLSFLCLLSFFMLARKIEKDSAIPKTAMFLFFPLIFPFFFLLYTDVYGMFFVILALGAALNRRFWLSGILGILGMLVRQNNIIWLAFIGTLAYFQNYYPQRRWEDVRKWILQFIFYFIAVIMTLAFILWNKGLVLGPFKDQHPFSVNCGNLFFLLFLFFFLFLPFNISNFRKIADLLKKHKLLWLILIELFGVYYFFFTAQHPYNQFGRILHNWILFAMKASFFSKALSFLPIAYAVLSLCVTKLERPSFYLLYPFTILFLVPLPVIEIRYLFIPFALFLLFKRQDTLRMTLFTLATYLVPIVVLMYLMTRVIFFP